MAAAATLGLSERADAGRDDDYRYVWLRDQAYAQLAAAVHEPHPLLDEAVAFTTARVLEHGDRLAPAYRLDGRVPPHEQDIPLPGYPGGGVRTGNWVRGQLQLDGCGELLELYAAAARHDHLRADDLRTVTNLVDVVHRTWDRPDAGIWELDDDWWTHSRLACVAGWRSVAAHVVPGSAGRAVVLADAIMAETSARCLGPDGAWMRSPRAAGRRGLLMASVRGALSSDDPRSRATVRAVSDQLTEKATSTATPPTAGRWGRPRVRSCCAGWRCRSPTWSRATRWRPTAGSSGNGGLRADGAAVRGVRRTPAAAAR